MGKCDVNVVNMHPQEEEFGGTMPTITKPELGMFQPLKEEVVYGDELEETSVARLQEKEEELGDTSIAEVGPYSCISQPWNKYGAVDGSCMVVPLVLIKRNVRYMTFTWMVEVCL